MIIYAMLVIKGEDESQPSKGPRSAFGFSFISSAVTICNYTGMVPTSMELSLPLTNLAS